MTTHDYVSLAAHDVLIQRLTMIEAARKLYIIAKQYDKSLTRGMARFLVENAYKRSLEAYRGHELELAVMRRNARSK